MPYDLLIKNGTIVDGTGRPGFRGDVALERGKIAAVGKATGSASRTIDAEGLVVSPGFFDVHTHYDCQILWDPLATSSSWHGITTILMGNCGFTIAPGRTSDSEYLMRLMARVEGIQYDVLQKGLDWSWDSFGQYLGRIGRQVGVNVAAQVGHSALRYYVMGKESYERAATQDEITRMKQVLRDALFAGAMGFSTSQTAHHTGGYGEPVPSRMSSREELTELCGVLSEFDQGIIGMNPHPGAGSISPEFEDVLIKLAKVARKPILWNQLMDRWDKPEEWKHTLAYMDRAAAECAPHYAVARCQPINVEFNLRRSYSFDVFPTWKDVMAKPHDEKKLLLQDPKVREKLRAEWDTMPQKVSGRRIDMMEVSRTKLLKNQHLQEKRLTDLAKAAGKSILDYVADLSLEEDLDTQFVFIGSLNGDPAAVQQIISHPYCVTGLSDAGAHLDNDCGVDFTGVLLGHWVREKGTMTIEEGVRRLTSMPAGILGIKDRGVLKEGLAGDLVVFDPKTIKALPRELWSDLPGGGQRIVQRAQGVRAVAVNGQLLFDDNKHTGALPGKVLTPAKANGR